MRLASFNLENIFDRAKAFNQDTMAEGKVILDAFARLNKLFGKPTYSAADKNAILKGLKDLGVLKDDNAGPFVRLRQNRGKLLKRPQTGPVEVVANGRGDWIGWLELKTERVNEIATQNTGQVVRDVAADVVGTIEVDNRIALLRFNEQTLPSVNAEPYPHVMLIDGNDDRGIDVGVMSRFPLGTMRSHVDDLQDGSRIFSRDCPEFEIALPSGNTLLVLVNHLKSKGFGTQADSNARRRRQAERVRAIYDARRQAGVTRIAVIGDFNDTPDSTPLAPLLANSSDLRDVSLHQNFHGDGRPGTFGNGTASQKIDYILLSPELFAQVTNAGVFRKGVWGGVNGTLFPHFPEMTKAIHAASDHAALFVDLDI
ncbi:MAG TPA: endonuclease/exonuclease/phosphatase family protein [Candidatus Acidoferrum sp.]|nr:endonuclease/exonuclease/phosphatase family protein [Candidatus Acidoferrum sp.]